MNIRRNDNCSVVFWLAIVCVAVLIRGRATFADARTAAEALIGTYKLAPAITTVEAESAVARLEKALADYEDTYLAFRIKYRMGVMYFKAHMMDASKAKFLQIVQEPACSELIRACSFNMIGQISRLKGENEEALKAFNHVANPLEQQLTTDKKIIINPALMKLLCSALFSRAEIYQLQRDYATSIAECNRLLVVLEQHTNDEAFCHHAALVNDRMSQLYLQQGDVDKYKKLAQALFVNYPEYYRAPIVKLEIECVKFLKNVSADFEFANGSFFAPAQTIAHLKTSKDKTSAKYIANKLDGLCKEDPNTYGGILLQYHYAWLLDTLGEKNKAAEILARISSTDIVETDLKSWQETVVETIQEYAKIQYAVMLGERTDYNEALKVLSSLQTHQDKSHISELAKSVSESIQILKREVPKNEKK